MAVSDFELCNLALSKLGETQFIASLNAATSLAKACKVVYDTSRDAVLETHPWPFATRRAQLNLLASVNADATDPLLRTGWAFVYALPGDMLPLCARYIETGKLNPAPDQQIPFELEDDADNGPVLVTNQEQAKLVYTRRVTEVVKMSALFQEALSWKLAYELCGAVQVKPAVADRMLSRYGEKLLEAQAASMKHRTPSAPARPAAIRAR